MKTQLLAVLVLMAFGCTAFPAERTGDVTTQELQNLQGTWTVVLSEQNGERRRDLEEVKKMRLRIQGDKWTLDFNNNVGDQRAATMKLDPTQKPKAVDFAFLKGLPVGETIRAIYELKGDDLKFCFPDESKERPKNFNTTEGPGGRWLLVLRRQK
jgi:uncharacterized protein (TIGR03067 family)